MFLTLFVSVPAVMFGIVVGPIAARFIDSTRWGSAAKDQQEYITLVHTSNSYWRGLQSNVNQGMTRVVIGIQLVIAGFQLPPKYFYKKWLPMFICLIPLMTVMWLFTTGCVMLTVPKLSLVSYVALPILHI